MNTKRITYLAAALALLGAATSCEHDEIYEDLEFSVHLAPGNTYIAGDPVVFDFGGNADFITVWNGDTGHEYQHRNRTSVALADIESCKLEIEIQQQYGDASPATNNLDILAGNKFGGLKGDDAEADLATVTAIAANDYADWKMLAFTPNRDKVWETYTYDITEFADNFSLALHFHQDPAKNMRTYYLNPRITVKFHGYDTQTYAIGNLSFVPFRTAGLFTDKTPYITAANEYLDIYKVNQNGLLKLKGMSNAIAGADIAVQGFTPGTDVNAGKLPGVTYQPIDQWLMMTPLALNSIAPDTGMNIKGVTDDVASFEYTYTEPGTYTATFIVSNGNYQGESERLVREVTFTVVDRIE